MQVTVNAVLGDRFVQPIECVECHFALVEGQELARASVVAQFRGLHGECALVVGHRLYEFADRVVARPCRCAQS